ncbi:MAG TPA: glycosyltransferase family 4 protein, partial [Stellaceae bacterium]|nr:glycosyltransferase family 4 protein [Stellaceae bacterium]
AQQNEELALADVVTAGCDYCARTLIENGCPAEKIRVINYGFDETLFAAKRPMRPPLGARPTNFLFVGAVNPRKGVATLLPAFARLPADRATLTLVGKLEIPRETFERYKGRVNHVGSVSRRDVVKYFLDADCFVFPSLFEGSALVLYEAIAAGLGIIQSIHAGAGARAGLNGEVLEDVTVDRLHAALEAVIAHPEQLTSWQDFSWQMRWQHTWRTYREHVAGLIIR